MTAPQPPENQNQGGQQAPGENNENKGGAAGDLPTTTHGAGQEGQGITSALGGSPGEGSDATQVVSPSGQQQAAPADASSDATQVVAGGASAQQPQQGYGQQPGAQQQPQWGAQQPQQQWGQQPPQQPGTPSGGFQQPAWGAQQQPGAQPQGQWGQQQQWGHPQQQGWGQPAASNGPPFLAIATWASFVIGGLGLILGLTQLPSLFAAMDAIGSLGSFSGGRIAGRSFPSSGTLTFGLILAFVQIALYPLLAFGAFWAGIKCKAQGRLIAGGAAAGIAAIGIIVAIMLGAVMGGGVWVGIILNSALAVIWFLPQTAAGIGTPVIGGGGGHQAQAWGQQQGQWGQQQPQQQGQWGQPQQQQQPQQQWGQQAPQQPQQQWGQQPQQPGQPGQQQGWPGQQ
ncbi:hypothetical protein NLX83_05485 [Allokutzneria sp. A3M-2-11 16]|uniref:hypothetical protein n=1 Tax=Allokutzneria sp. A3M-2-11 16 TaxID=2962043 RepID=UPI0020B81854|nr:hypothetical protein [Allokutzneria sp. A3M-2-11 16]MCP3798705.1 hypothetical protein [Allokutzneria sp. A3M-2-11 16]